MTSVLSNLFTLTDEFFLPVQGYKRKTKSEDVEVVVNRMWVRRIILEVKSFIRVPETDESWLDSWHHLHLIRQGFSPQLGSVVFIFLGTSAQGFPHLFIPLHDSETNAFKFGESKTTISLIFTRIQNDKKCSAETGNYRIKELYLGNQWWRVLVLSC